MTDDHARNTMQLKGFEECKKTLSFIRFIQKRRNITETDYIREKMGNVAYDRYKTLSESYWSRSVSKIKSEIILSIDKTKLERVHRWRFRQGFIFVNHPIDFRVRIFRLGQTFFSIWPQCSCSDWNVQLPGYCSACALSGISEYS